MNTFLIIAFIIVTIIVLLIFYYNHLSNKYNDLIIKINASESKIDSNLKEKYNLLDDVITLAKDLIKLDKKLPNDILKLRATKGTNYDFDRTLYNINNEFMSIYNDKKDLKKDDKVIKTVKQIKDIDEELITLRDYYNENITDYNKMITHFPSNIVAKIKKLTLKQLYILENKEEIASEETL